MKPLRFAIITKLVFLLVVFSLFTGVDRGLVFGGADDRAVLARVEVEKMVNDLDLPVYAHLRDATGNDYALVIASKETLDRSGARYRVLDKQAKGKDYFILYRFQADKRTPKGRLKNVLLDDGEHILVRSTFKQVEAYVEDGYDVRWLGDRPMVLDVNRELLAAQIVPLVYNATIQQMINQVNQTTLFDYSGDLTGENSVDIGGSPYTITTRYTNSGAPVQQATQFVYEFMEGLGLAVSYHNWSRSGYTGRNVIGEKSGATQPDEIVLITAHLDNMPSSGSAPGADDNGSGSVGVMMCAEILSQYQFSRTIRFIFYTGEEQGLLGSYEYSDLVFGAGDNIVAVYNMDMLGYDGVGDPYLRLHTRTSSSGGYDGDLAIANTFVDVVTDYGLSAGLSPIVDSDGMGQSDHVPFWNNGYSAILSIEDHDNDITPYYHTSSDTRATLNMPYFTDFVKASVGTTAHLAIVDDGTLIAGFTGSPTSGPAPLTVNFTDQSTGATSWSWDFGDTGTSAEQNPIYTYNTPGVYTVSLTVGNGTGSDTETKVDYITVTAPQPPVADFTANNTNPYTGQSVTFTDTSINVPTSWSWTFEGGTPGTSTDQNPVITYNTVGAYTVTLTASNAQGSDDEIKTGYITVTDAPLAYCDSQGNNYSMEYIGNVTVGSFSNSSGGSNYTDFTNLTAYVTAGENVSVSLTPVFPSSTYTEYWKIWIDYNVDGDFGDPGEEVFSAGGSTTTVTGNFTVASVTATTRMRVSMKWNSAPTSCESFSYGEVEDYTIDISGGSPPVAEFTASATTITEGQSVDFTDLSTNNPTSWSWTFDGGTPGTSTAQNPTVTYNTAGTYTVELTATNAAGSDTETKAGYITVNPPAPPVADFTASATTIIEGQSVTFTDTSTGNPTSWSWTFSGGTPASSSAQNPTITYNTAGTYTVELTATNAGGSDTETKTDYITVNAVPGGITFETGTVSNVGDSWQTVTLQNTYSSMVVVCTTGIADSSATPAVTRVRNASGGSFDVMAQNPSGTGLSGYTVHYMVVEEGVYTQAQDGVTMEAVKVNSTVTAENNNWVTEARSYQNSYSNPVVVGQVMTYNDPSWSTFWASGSTRQNPPSASTFNAGKQVGEDPDATRADETIGYIVIEQGSGSINGIPYNAALGSDIVRGPGNTSSGYTYSFGSVANANAAIFSAAAMDGGNGGWPVMYGSNPLTSTSLTLVFDEDQLNDSERKHGTEQVAYIVFGQ
jgi:PKD repeat protein